MKIKRIFHYIAALLTLIILVIFVVINTPSPASSFEAYVPYIGYITSGFIWTILISILIFMFSFILGFVMFFTHNSKIPYVEYLTKLITTIMFGSPMLVIVIVSYFFIGTALGINSKLFLGITALTIYFAPFMMKLFISAHSSINKNQFIVSDLFGFTKLQMYRYIIFPQMLRIMLPPLSGNLATIIKSSSLLYLIGFNELYYNITLVQSRTFAYTEGYIIMMILYLLITIPLLKLTSYLEVRLKI